MRLFSPSRRQYVGVAIAPLCLALLLSSCGGGGGGGGGTTLASNYSIESAVRGLLQGTRTSTLTGTITVGTTSLNGTGNFTESALAATSFNGATVQGKTTTKSLTAAPTSTSSTEQNFYDSNLVALGSINSLGTLYYTASTLFPFPTVASVPKSDTRAVYDYYLDAAKTVRVGTITETWSLATDASGAAQLTQTFVTRTIAGTTISTTVETSRLDNNSVATRRQISTTIAGQSTVYNFP